MADLESNAGWMSSIY